MILLSIYLKQETKYLQFYFILLKYEKRKQILYLTMPIIINLDVMLARRKMSLTELAEKVGITIVNLSILKTGKAKGVRFDTLEAICRALDCKPGDIIDIE